MALNPDPLTEEEPKPMETMHFTFSDTIAGSVAYTQADEDTFTLRTIDGREFDGRAHRPDVRGGHPQPRRGLHRRDGPDARHARPRPHALRLRDLLPGGRRATSSRRSTSSSSAARAHDFVFERPDWWVKQVREIADFYLQAQFGRRRTSTYAEYRTQHHARGREAAGDRQETDTISRLVYGFATAYLLTGEDRFLEAAETGTEYLRDHMRTVDAERGHRLLDPRHRHRRQPKEKKILASEFGDDYDAIPAYEQIYALAGPTQTFRVTGDPRILNDIEMTIELFNRFYLDREDGGYFSHIDPITFDPHSETLGHNQARKNWNSVGDHAPAYLINRGSRPANEKYADFLEHTADTIAQPLPRLREQPVREGALPRGLDARLTLGLAAEPRGRRPQPEDRLEPDAHATACGRTTSTSSSPEDRRDMPPVGSDRQRGGWYDVMERVRQPGEESHRFAWHDRKAWWQQEQAILAYLILHGILGDEEYLRLRRATRRRSTTPCSSTTTTGAVYFNVLANGMPYLLGTERLKGSHSMSGYHTTELCYLAAVYTNLLITKQPLDLHFKPRPGDLQGPHPARLAGHPAARHDPDRRGLDRRRAVRGVRRRQADGQAARGQEAGQGQGARRVDARDVRERAHGRERRRVDHAHRQARRETVTAMLERDLERALAGGPQRVVLHAERLDSMSSAGARALLFARQRMDISDRADIYAVAPNAAVREALLRADPDQEDINVVESYDPFRDSDKKGKRPDLTPSGPAGQAGPIAGCRPAPVGATM